MNRAHCPVVDVGIAIAKTLHRLYPAEFELDKLNKLLGDVATLEAIRADRSLEDIRELWAPGRNGFLERRREFLLYPNTQ